MIISLRDPETDAGEHVALLELPGGVGVTIMRAAMYSGAAQRHPHTPSSLSAFRIFGRLAWSYRPFHSFENYLTRDEAGPMRSFIAACLLCASLLTRIPPLASTSPFSELSGGAEVATMRTAMYSGTAQRCIAAPHSRSEARLVFQGEENIPDDKVRSDLTEVAKLVYEHMKLELRHKRSKYVWRPWRPQLSHQLLFGRRPWFRHWLPVWEPGFPLHGSSRLRGAEAETCLQSYWLVEWALGVGCSIYGVGCLRILDRRARKPRQVRRL
jgi:hypothetical protein